jgi:Leucine-rich repeat (LRR) protein
MIIDLSGLKISELPDSLFKKADQITKLNIGSSGDLFVAVYPEVRPLPFGTGVRNNFTELTSRIGLLKNLKVVDLSFNNLVTLPSEFYSLPLEELNLNFNYNFDLQAESSKISQLKKLKKLLLTGVRFNSFPDEILQLDLEELEVGNFNLVIDELFIERISKFRNLKALYLSDVDMEELPENFHILQSLEKLDIRYSPTKELRSAVPALRKLSNLKTINLYSLPLTLEEVSFLTDALPGVEIDFLSN